MAFNYAEARLVAEELITEFGESATVYSESSTTTDAFGDEVVILGEVISGTVTPILSYAATDIDGVNVKTGDGYVYFHSDFAPEINMVHEQNGIKYRVINIDSLDSVGGVNVYRKLQLRS